MIITNERLLRVKCEDVLEDEIGPLIEQLDKELKKSEMLGQPGIGLSAPQIGIAKNIAIIRLDNGVSLNLVNAKIEKGYNKAIFDNEGCLSFPGRYEKVFRYQEILVKNNLVKPESFVCTGLLAVVCQHELDHLIGKLLSDYALKKKIVKANRNDPCPCGSLKKYKKCCGKF